MKKTILFLLVLFLFGITKSQTLDPPIDFESAVISYTFSDFDGGVATVINNPQINGINTSSKVGRMVKGIGQVWGGSLLTMDNPLDFSQNKIFTIKVFSPRAGARLLLKVEDPQDAGIFHEIEDTSTVANAWEELSFDFSLINTGNTYQKIVLTWDMGIMGDGSANFTFFFDDISLNSLPLNQIHLPITFEDPTVDYTLTDFGGNSSYVITDPQLFGNKVVQTTKDVNAVAWAGTVISTPQGLANAIPFAPGSTTIIVVVFSWDAGVPIRLKAEDHTDPGISVETEVLTTMAGVRETLVFDFSNQVNGTDTINFANTYDLLSIFFNFGTDGATAGAQTYYWDDVMFSNITHLDLPEFRGLSYYPNPTSDLLTIDADTPIETVVVFDLMGKEMFRKTGYSSQLELELNQLASGIYVVNVTSATATSHFRVQKQ